MKVQVGDVVKLQRQLGRGVVRYVGSVDFSTGEWYGVELKQPRGKHNGTVNGKQYFVCEKGYGLFVKKNQIQNVVEAAKATAGATTNGESGLAKGTRVSYTTPAGQKGDGTLDRKQGTEWRVVPEKGDPLWIDEKNLVVDDDEGRERRHSNATPLEDSNSPRDAKDYPDVPAAEERRGRSNSTSSAKGPGNWRVGDLVQVYSNSKQKWFDDGKIDKIHAGRIFVVYNGTETKKWLPEKSNLVKTSQRPGADYSNRGGGGRRRSQSRDRPRSSLRSGSLSRKARPPVRTASVIRANRASLSAPTKPRSASFQPTSMARVGPRGDAKTWTVIQVKVWLKGIGLERYSEAFEETNVTGAILLDMNSDDLQKLGAHVIHTKKLIREIETLKKGGKSDKRSAFNLKQWRQAIKSKVLMTNQSIGTEVRTDIVVRQESRKLEEIEDLAVKREYIEGHKEVTAAIKEENEEARILYVREVYVERKEENKQLTEKREAEEQAELICHRENIEQFKQAVELTKDAIKQQQDARRQMVYKTKKDETAEFKETREQDAVTELAAFREYIVAFKSGVVKIKAENQVEAEQKAKEWYKQRCTERAANINQIEEESAEELVQKQAYIQEHTEVTAEIKAENEAVAQQNIQMWQQRRKTERDANVAQIEEESAEELASKQENIIVFKDEVVAIKTENAAQAQQLSEEYYRRRVTERAQNIETIETENAEELAGKQENIAVFKEDVQQVKAENVAVKEQNIQLWQERRKTERNANIAQIEEESAEELAYKQENIQQHKSKTLTIKADNMAEAMRLAEEWYRRRVTERRSNIEKRDAEAAQEVAYKQENIAVHQENTAQIKAENTATADQQRQMWQERRKTERAQNIATIEQESAEELAYKQENIQVHKEAVADVKADNSASAEQNRQMWQERRKTERAKNIATIEHESAEELAYKQENIAVFKDQVVDVKAENAANAESQRVEWYRRRVTERKSNIEKIEVENATELAEKQENIAVFSEDVQAVKAENEAVRQQNVQMWQERRKTERAQNVATIEAESAEELAQKQEFIVVFKDGVMQIKEVNAKTQQDQQEVWYKTRVEERMSNINQRDTEAAQEVAEKQENVIVFKDQTHAFKAANAAAAEQNRQGFWQARMTERAANIQSIETESAEELAAKQEYIGVHKDQVAVIKDSNAAVAEEQRAEWYRSRVEERTSNIEKRDTDAAHEIAEKQENVVVFKDSTAQTKAENVATAEQNRAGWQEARRTERVANINQIEQESAEELANKQEYIQVHGENVAQVKAENTANQQQQVAAWQQARATERAANIATIENESAEELAMKQTNVGVHKDSTAQIKTENAANMQMQQQYWQERRATEKKQNIAQIETENQDDLLGKQEQVDLHRSAQVQSKQEIEAARDQWLSEVKDMHGAYKDELSYKREMGYIEDVERIEAARWTSLPDSYLNAFNSMDLDGDGQIDFVEFQAAINSLGLNWDEQETWRVFRNIDADNSGALDLEEFEAVIRKVEDILQSNPDADSKGILRMTFENIDRAPEVATT